jgi:hypothetical protein
MISKRLAKWDVNIRDAIKMYLLITKPLHNLRAKQLDMLTLMLLKFNNERSNFKRTSDVWKIVFSADSLAEIRMSLNMNKGVFHNYIHRMRKLGVIKNDQIAPEYNPLLEENVSELQITFLFKIKPDG